MGVNYIYIMVEGAGFSLPPSRMKMYGMKMHKSQEEPS